MSIEKRVKEFLIQVLIFIQRSRLLFLLGHAVRVLAGEVIALKDTAHTSHQAETVRGHGRLDGHRSREHNATRDSWLGDRRGRRRLHGCLHLCHHAHIVGEEQVDGTGRLRGNSGGKRSRHGGGQGNRRLVARAHLRRGRLHIIRVLLHRQGGSSREAGGRPRRLRVVAGVRAPLVLLLLVDGTLQVKGRLRLVLGLLLRREFALADPLAPLAPLRPGDLQVQLVAVREGHLGVDGVLAGPEEQFLYVVQVIYLALRLVLLRLGQPQLVVEVQLGQPRRPLADESLQQDTRQRAVVLLGHMLNGWGVWKRRTRRTGYLTHFNLRAGKKRFHPTEHLRSS